LDTAKNGSGTLLVGPLGTAADSVQACPWWADCKSPDGLLSNRRPKFSFGLWLKNAAPRMHRNKLATALANKLARIARSVLSTGKLFDTHNLELEAV